MDTSQIVRELIAYYGGEIPLAAELNVGQSSVNRWVHGGEIKGRNLFRIMALYEKSLHFKKRNDGHHTQSDSQLDAFKPQITPGNELVGDKNFPVYAAAMGGDGHQIVTFEAIDYVKRPAVLENVKNAYGLYIVGESMSPAYEPGDMALVHPHLPPARDKNVVLYHVPPAGTGDVEAIVKRLVRWTETEWVLRQYNPMKEFSEARADWTTCHRIVGKYDGR